MIFFSKTDLIPKECPPQYCLGDICRFDKQGCYRECAEYSEFESSNTTCALANEEVTCLIDDLGCNISFSCVFCPDNGGQVFAFFFVFIFQSFYIINPFFFFSAKSLGPIPKKSATTCLCVFSLMGLNLLRMTRMHVNLNKRLASQPTNKEEREKRQRKG